MDPSSKSLALMGGWMIIGLSGLFGIGIMFARPTHLERRTFVGVVTLAGTALAAWMFSRLVALGGPFNWLQMIGTAAIPLTVYLVARLVDRFLGEQVHDPERDQQTLGAHLSD